MMRLLLSVIYLVSLTSASFAQARVYEFDLSPDKARVRMQYRKQRAAQADRERRHGLVAPQDNTRAVIKELEIQERISEQMDQAVLRISSST